MSNNSAARSVGVVSLGCVKNRVDTEEMLGNLKAAGWQATPNPQDATVLVVNTCGFIEPAKQESINTILELARYKKTGSCRALCVTGCLAQRYGDTLFQEMPEIDVLVGINQYDRLPSILNQALEGDRVLNTHRRRQEIRAPRALTTPPFSAYVRIGDGCDNRCSYCAIPLIRGGHVSRTKDDVLSEMRSLAQKGVKEQILVAQDTTRFGMERAKAWQSFWTKRQTSKVSIGCGFCTCTPTKPTAPCLTPWRGIKTSAATLICPCNTPPNGCFKK